MADLKQYMQKPFPQVGPRVTLRGAARKMRKERCSYLIVVEKRKSIGIITEADLARRAIPMRMSLDRTTVRRMMSSPLISLDVNSSMKQANSLMKTRRIRHLLVMAHGKPVGLVTLLGLLRYFSDLVR